MKPGRLDSSLLSWLRCFEAVGRHKSFTIAAEELFITQSAVSQQIKKLEQRLGVGLIERSRQGLSVTVEGQQLHQAVNIAFNGIKNAIEHLNPGKATLNVELICAPSFALRWLMPRLSKFYSRHPDISLRVRADFHTLEYGARATGQGVMALIYGTEPFEVNLRTEILEEWLVPVCSTQFINRNSGIRSPSDLQAHHLLHDDVAWRGASPYAEWAVWLKQNGVREIKLQGGQRYNLSTLAIEAALAHQGIAMGRVSMIMDDLQNKRLVKILDGAVKSPASYWLVQDDNPSPQEQIVKNWLLNEARTYRKRHPVSPPE